MPWLCGRLKRHRLVLEISRVSDCRLERRWTVANAVKEALTSHRLAPRLLAMMLVAARASSRCLFRSAIGHTVQGRVTITAPGTNCQSRLSSAIAHRVQGRAILSVWSEASSRLPGQLQSRLCRAMGGRIMDQEVLCRLSSATGNPAGDQTVMFARTGTSNRCRPCRAAENRLQDQAIMFIEPGMSSRCRPFRATEHLIQDQDGLCRLSSATEHQL